MKWSETFIPTLKEIPKEAEAISHQLMLRAGLIRKISSGLYLYLPLGLKVIDKVKRIIREEMNKKGAVELGLSALQPKEVWEKSNRWDEKSLGMMKLKDRQDKEFVLGPTHEEIITLLVAGEIKSYKQLPINLYQIQTKFRDEIRPRFGVIRAKEFIMKDAYSFDVDESSAQKSYMDMYEAYANIFKRCGLNAKAVDADTGAMGGKASQQFVVLAKIGEDTIISCPKCSYAADSEAANSKMPDKKVSEKEIDLKEVDTPGIKTIDDISKFLKIPSNKIIKSVIYEIKNDNPVMILISGDREVNESKLNKLFPNTEINMAGEAVINKITNAMAGFSGPVGLKNIKIWADESIKFIKNGVAGANKNDKHYINVNLNRDFKPEKFIDISHFKEGDLCAECGSKLKTDKGIEVGQIFNLGTKYSESLGAYYLNPEGKENPMIMGCYGIGVTRTIAAIIENHRDDKGIMWPKEIAPYSIEIIPLDKNEEILKVTTQIYNELKKINLEALIDDRDERPGIKFNDADLLGIPIQIIIGKKKIKDKKVEIKSRDSGKREDIDVGKAVEYIRKTVDSE
jgi:prolyl-tRNA synthetase